MRKIICILVVMALHFGAESAWAQNDNNVLLYNTQATLFGEQGPAYDPISIILPGTAMKSGIGSFIDNPASMALYDESIGEFGFSYGNISEDGTYRGNTNTMDNDQFNFSNLGFVYSFPTDRGSLVFGGSYTKHTTFNRALSFGARNDENTITDAFKIDGSPYQEIAYNTYATDVGDNVGDWDESVFRIGFDDYGDYFGIYQQGEIIQNGSGGEYALFLATEFQKNFMVGASIGLLSGKFTYDRVFQEIDEYNDYSSDILDVDGGTDIDNILLDDHLTTRYTGFRARVGLLYKANENMNVGFSYTLPSTIFVDEDFDASITTTFDSGGNAEDATNSEFSYNVKSPGRLALGAALQDFNGFSISVSAEYIDYSNTEIVFDDSDYFDDEVTENEHIADTYDAIWSYRAGVAYAINPDLTIRGGYGFKPSRFMDGGDDQTSYSFGAGFTIAEGIRFETAARYTAWDEVSTVYEYGEYDYNDLPENLPSVTYQSEDASRSANHWQLLGTLRVNF